MVFIDWKDDTLILRIKAIPRAKKTGVTDVIGNAIKCKVNAPPVDGKANQAIIHYLAKQFKTPKKQISIISGESSPHKTIHIRQPVQLPDWCQNTHDKPAFESK